MTLRLNVGWRGREVEDAFEGTVHSVFHRACNLLEARGSLVAVLGPALPRAAWSLRLEALPCPLDASLRPGMRFVCHGGLLRIADADMVLDMTPARLWSGDQLALGGKVSQAARRQVLACAKRAGWPGLCALLVPQPSFSGLDGVLLARFAAGRSGLCWSLQHGRVDEAVETARALMGLGTGLTPAGDDFLGGFLAGLRVNANNEEKRALAAAFGAALFPHVAASTNRISGAFLTHACLGSFSENMGGLARALCHGSSGPELDRRTAALLAFGGSSGADALAGLLSAITPYSEM